MIEPIYLYSINDIPSYGSGILILGKTDTYDGERFKYKDGKIYDRPSGLWIKKEAFKYYVDPLLMAFEKPEEFKKIMLSSAEYNKRREALNKLIEEQGKGDLTGTENGYSQYIIIGILVALYFWTAT